MHSTKKSKCKFSRKPKAKQIRVTATDRFGKKYSSFQSLG